MVLGSSHLAKLCLHKFGLGFVIGHLLYLGTLAPSCMKLALLRRLGRDFGLALQHHCICGRLKEVLIAMLLYVTYRLVDLACDHGWLVDPFRITNYLFLILTQEVCLGISSFIWLGPNFIICICIFISTHMCICIYGWPYACIYEYMNVCMNECICMHECMYVCMYECLCMNV